MIDDQKNKLLQYSLVIFAFFGFISSLVSVFAFFYPSETSSLEARVTQERFRVPLYIGQDFKNYSDSNRLITTWRTITCDDLNEDIVSKHTMKEIGDGSIVGHDAQSASLCKLAQEAETAALWAGDHSDQFYAMYIIEFTNNGSKIANGLKIGSDKIAAIQRSQADNYVDITSALKDGFYPLPDLNPKESMKVIAWAKSPIGYSFRYIDKSDLPSITYSGGSVDIKLMREVPEFWYNLFDIFEGIPLLITIPFLISICIGVASTVLISMAVIDALIRGKPLREIFKNAEANPTTA